MSIRTSGIRRFAYSHDAGNTWDKPVDTSIVDSNCNGDIIRLTSIKDGYDKDRIIHTIPFNKPSERKNVSVLLSYDEGSSWPVSKVINPKMSGYSAATIDHDGMIHVYYEENVNPNVYDYNFNMSVASFSLEWLTDGKDTIKKSEGIDWCVCDGSELECAGGCPSGSFSFSTKVFDQYYDSYWEYPTKLKYTLMSEVKAASLDLSIPGLTRAEYNNKMSAKQSLRISGSGRSTPTLQFHNMIINTDIDTLNHFGESKFEDSYIKLDEMISKIEIGKTKIRITKKSALLGSTTAVLTTSEFGINIYHTDYAIKIVNGISDMPGEEKALVKTKLSVENKTRINIVGKWEKQNVQCLTIYKPTANMHFAILTSDPTIYDNLLIIEAGKPITPFPQPKPTENQGEDSNINDKNKSKTPTGTIVGIVIGVIIVIVACAVVGFFIWKKKHNNPRHNSAINNRMV